MSGLKPRLPALGMLLALVLGGASTAAPAPPEDIPVAVVERGAATGSRVAYPGDGSELGVRLAFHLPPPDGTRWVLWLPHDPFDTVHVRAPGWAPPGAGYFRPHGSDPMASTGYAFALPAGWSGPREIELSLRGGVRAAPTPRVMSERRVLARMAGDNALAYGVYAALATLAIAALALYAAVRDGAFLMFVGYALTALLLGATVNGHVYGLPGVGSVGRLGAPGFWATVLAFAGLGLHTLARYAAPPAETGMVWPQRLSLLLLGVALLLPLPSAALRDLQEALAVGGGALALLVALVVVVDAVRRRVSMAPAVLVALLLLGVAVGAHAFMQAGRLPDTAWTRYGHQLALVLLSVVVYVGLCSRIGQVRRRLDDEATARRDSERRLRHEQDRASFAHDLQAALRGAPGDAIATITFRLLGQHAAAQLGTDDVVVVAEGYGGHERLLVQAMAGPAATADAVLPALALVREHAAHAGPSELRLETGRRGDGQSTRLHAVVPLPLSAPAWAALVAALPFDRGPGAETFAALAELARIAVEHAEEANATQQLRLSAEHDALTGSLNRRALDRVLARAFHASTGILSVLFIDIDWFKRVNDTHGHASGDHCLRSIAATLRAELRPGDALGRYGGEEFLVVLPGQDAAAARVLGERLRRTVEHTPVLWRGELMTLTVSIGLATRMRGETDPATLLERADTALYRAKREGRNCVRSSAIV